MSQESGNKWAMPEPIFRHSAGELVKPSKPVEFDNEPDTLVPESPEHAEFDVDPEADTLVPNAPGDDVDADADTLVPDALDDADLAVAPEAGELPTEHPESKSAEDPLAKLYSPPEDTPDEPAPPTTPASPTAVEIEPQPYVSEQFSAEKIVVETETRPAKGSARPIVLAIGIFILLCVAAGIVALVYYLLNMNRADTGGF